MYASGIARSESALCSKCKLRFTATNGIQSTIIINKYYQECGYKSFFDLPSWTHAPQRVTKLLVVLNGGLHGNLKGLAHNLAPFAACQQRHVDLCEFIVAVLVGRDSTQLTIQLVDGLLHHRRVKLALHRISNMS